MGGWMDGWMDENQPFKASVNLFQVFFKPLFFLWLRFKCIIRKKNTGFS
jgi:hypothetical protein